MARLLADLQAMDAERDSEKALRIAVHRSKRQAEAELFELQVVCVIGDHGRPPGGGNGADRDGRAGATGPHAEGDVSGLYGRSRQTSSIRSVSTYSPAVSGS